MYGKWAGGWGRGCRFVTSAGKGRFTCRAAIKLLEIDNYAHILEAPIVPAEVGEKGGGRGVPLSIVKTSEGNS